MIPNAPMGQELIPVNEEELAQMLQAAQEESDRKQRLLVNRIERCRDAAMRDKAPIERRWVDDLKRIRGELSYDSEPTKQFPVERHADEQPHLGYVKARCDQISARLSDMMFPHSDRNWDMKPTPKPEVYGVDPEMMRKAADQACGKMRQTIDDQLAESKFNATGRRIVKDCVDIGSGIIKGPALTIKRRMKFMHGQMQLIIDESVVPGAEYCDPWKFFPELVESMEEATHCHQFHLWSRAKLEEMLQSDFFIEGSIARVLKSEGNVGVDVAKTMKHRCEALGQQESLTDRYAIWESYKYLDPEDLELLGLDPDQGGMVYEIWHCNGIPLKIRPALLEQDNRLPYYVVPYNRADDTMFGNGVSYLLRKRDRDIQASWRMFLTNLSVSSGPLVVTRANSWKPADGNRQIRGPKVIEIIEDHGRVSLDDIIRVVTFNNHAQEHMAALDKQIALADEEIGMPAIMAGNPSQAVPTSSGLAMLMNASNIVQRQFAKAFDDFLISPLIERFYWWNQLYNEDDEIKGDFDIHPLGTSQLLVKDIQAQHLQIFTQLAGDPRFALYVDPYQLLQAHLKMLDMPTDDFVIDQETAEKKAAESQQEPPELMKLRAEMELAQAKLQAETENKVRDDEFRSHERMLKHEEFQQEQETKRMIAQATLQGSLLELEGKLAGIDATNEAKQVIESARQETTRIIEAMKIRMKAEEQANYQAEMALKLNPANQSGLGV